MAQNDEDIAAKREKAKVEQFATLGAFVQDFELVCDQLRSLFIWSFHLHGLSGFGQPMTQVVMHHKAMTADPLVSIVAAVYRYAVRGQSPYREVMDDVEKRFKKLGEKRNMIVHATWMIGSYLGTDTEFEEMNGCNFKTTKAGTPEHQAIPRDAPQLKASSAEANALVELCEALSAPLTVPSNFKPSRTFYQEGGKWHLTP